MARSPTLFVLLIAAWLALSGYAAVYVASQPNRSAPLRTSAVLPGRPISTTLQADEILLTFRPAIHVVAVTPFADDTSVSNVASPAKSVRARIVMDAERILALRPSVVFVSAFNRPEPLALLAVGHVPVVPLADPNTLADVRRAIATVADAVEMQDEGRAIVRAMDRDIEDAIRDAESMRARARDDKPRILLYMPGGYTAGAHTLFDELLHLLGLRNAAAEAGIEGHQTLSVERAIALDADGLVFAEYRADAGERPLGGVKHLARNPALARSRAVLNGHVLEVPAKHLLSTSHFVVKTLSDLKPLLRMPMRSRS